ncbi:hypothetical protein DWU98_15680 [Dyella monticola]|uniref:Uncharacterized protein n=1 Tax=Dyella monticola TaxID=1927958 RepID=A0A370WV03_9GAMM|nr:hypothetical protein [Dyella monticola]RDS79881.1 hypothetical protein DWU98_15680 [Dyella monticola]
MSVDGANMRRCDGSRRESPALLISIIAMAFSRGIQCSTTLRAVNSMRPYHLVEIGWPEARSFANLNGLGWLRLGRVARTARLS